MPNPLLELLPCSDGRGHVHLDKNDPHARLFPTGEIGEDARFAFSGRLMGPTPV